MKIENKYRLIKINIKDPGKYTDVALVVDDLKFLKMIESIRKVFEIKPISQFDKSGMIELGDFEYKLIEDEHLGREFKRATERIRAAFKLPPHYLQVIESALLHGEVNDSYEKAYLEETLLTPLVSEHDVPDLKHSIVIHAGTRWDDVKAVFNQFIEKVKDAKRRDKNFMARYEYEHLSIFKDVAPSIERYRKYYQDVINGIKPLKIALKQLGISQKEYQLIKKSEPIHGDKRDLIYKTRNTIKAEATRYKKAISKRFL